MANFIQRLFPIPPALSERALVLPTITISKFFERNTCPWIVQKHRIDFAHCCINRYQNCQLCRAVVWTNWQGLRTQSSGTGTWICSVCTHWKYVSYTSEWVVVLPTTISLPNFCWVSGTWLQARIYQCQPKNNISITYHLGPIYWKSPGRAWYHLTRLSFFSSCIILQLESTKSDPPSLEAHGHWKQDINRLGKVWEDPFLGITFWSSIICSGGCINV